MARRYDDTDTDNDLISDWKDTGLFNDRVIKSHRAPQMSRSRKAIISAASIFMATTTGVAINSYNNRHTSHIAHARADDRELASLDDVERQLRIGMSSRNDARTTQSRALPFTIERAMMGSRPKGDARHYKRALTLPHRYNHS